MFWVDYQPFLLSRGYKLRPRYQPDWVPSWGTQRITQEEDSLLLIVSVICDPLSLGWCLYVPALRGNWCCSNLWQLKSCYKEGQHIERRINCSTVPLLRRATVWFKKPNRTHSGCHPCTWRGFIRIHCHANASTVWSFTISTFWRIFGSSTPILTSMLSILRFFTRMLTRIDPGPWVYAQAQHST